LFAVAEVKLTFSSTGEAYNVAEYYEEGKQKEATVPASVSASLPDS